MRHQWFYRVKKTRKKMSKVLEKQVPHREDRSSNGEFLRKRKKQVVHFFLKPCIRKKQYFTFLGDLRLTSLFLVNLTFLPISG